MKYLFQPVVKENQESSTMKRTVFSQQDTTTKNGSKDLDDNPNESTQKRKSVVVASLAVDRSHSSHSYSSLALSPKGRYALVAGKETIQLVTVGPDGLKTLRSMKIAHHFYNTSPSSPSTASTNIDQQHRKDVRGAFRLAAETRASAVTAGVANMNMNQQYGNFIVTKVAWSKNFYYSSSSSIRHNSIRGSQRGSQRGSKVGGSNLVADPGLDESSRSINTVNADMYEQSKHQKGRRRVIRQDLKRSEDDDGNRADILADESMEEDDSLVAAAGSNGVVIVWSAKRLLFTDSGKGLATKTGGGFISATSLSSASAAFLAEKQQMQQPEGILNQHIRAVNGMAWHPIRSGLLLTASQDGTIKLWERRLLTRSGDGSMEETNDKKLYEQSQSQHQRSWFSMMGGVVGGGSRTGGTGSLSMDDNSDDARKYTWGCKATYSLGEQDAIRDISWSKLIPDVFGVVTSNGNLVVYNMHVSVKALVKIAAHTGDAASLDWHPRWPFVVATGGSSDRLVKIWDLESSLASIVNTTSQRKEVQHHRKEVQQNHNENSSTFDTSKSDTSSYSASSNDSL